MFNTPNVEFWQAFNEAKPVIERKTIEFFKVVQNKLLWAISEQTAAELVYRRVDASLPLLGMQSFDPPAGKASKKNPPSVKKTDVSIAKNYLNENELENFKKGDIGIFSVTVFAQKPLEEKCCPPGAGCC